MGKIGECKIISKAQDLTIDCSELGEITFDVSYGGNYYAIIDPQQNFSGVQDFTASKLIQYSQIMRKSINQKYPDMFIHPENETIRDVSHLLWTGTPLDPTSSGRNAVFYGDKAINVARPCGTGTSARIAQLHAKGKLKMGEDFIHEELYWQVNLSGELWKKLLSEISLPSYQVFKVTKILWLQYHYY
ncbi:MAG: proline racemase family protein [Arcicella sp.]|nr:proline racemase family protein [Arcicella sp.]